jgi:hypothetical protein
MTTLEKEVRSYSDALTLKLNEYTMSLESKQKNTAQKNIKNIRIYLNFIMVFGPTCIYQILYKFVLRDWIRYVCCVNQIKFLHFYSTLYTILLKGTIF